MSHTPDGTGPAPDAIVVGAGVIGAAIALELQRGGRQVMVVDKGEAVGGGTTSASSSIVRFTYSTVEGVALSWEAMHRWRAWADHLGRHPGRAGTGEPAGPLATFHRIGMLFLEPPGTDHTDLFRRFDRVGVAHEVLDGAELARRFPAVDPGRFGPPRLPADPAFAADADGSVVGTLTPDAGFVDDPGLAAVNLMDAAVAAGARVLLRRRVAGVLRSGGRVVGVELEGGERLEAPVVVNAAGPWSAALNRLAGVEDDMAITNRPLRQDVGSTPVAPGFGVGDGGVVLGDLDLGFYARPQPGGSFLVGGVEADCDPLVWVDDPDGVPDLPDPDAWETVVLRAARRIPELPVPHRPVGLVSTYDVTDDWSPIYDRSSLDGFYLAIGTSGNQFKNAPVVGELMATLINAVEAGHDHDAEPVPFRCRTSGIDLDLGHFSRRRDPAASTGTVMG